MAMAKFYQYFNRTLVASDDRMDERAFAFGDGFLVPSACTKVRSFLLNYTSTESRMV
ncbi:hypothetical protein [Moraxella catarrhalis]|uniref:hypothetical protein n=1 Tax=Moraxella catarrhalis TaxID=480 RepID=UPI0021616EDB|nr:hypothetical protein [Moraxella catarrhalis]